MEKQNAELRNASRTLNEQLDLAIASIQRLTLENHRLRQELETSTDVTGLARSAPVAWPE
jgi:hypothetical protein